VSHRLGLVFAAAALMVAVGVTGCTQGTPKTTPSPDGSTTLGLTSATPPCSASLLFKAALTAQPMTTDRASYPPQPSQGPGAYSPVCDRGWAIALISHPNVGTTDGFELFHARGGSWTYLGGLGGELADCSLEHDGVPPSIAKVLLPPSQSPLPYFCSQ
jgi:hypothetical protein